MTRNSFGPLLIRIALLVLALGSYWPQGLAQAIDLKPGEIGGTITNVRNDRPPRKATVKLYRLEEEGCVWRSVEQTTTTNGEYGFPRQRSGTYFVRAEGGSLKPANKKVLLDEDYPFRTDLQVEMRMRGAGGDSGGLRTGREFLPDKQDEAKDYGLYSYLLFTGQAAEGSVMERRYEAALGAYLRTETARELEEEEKEKKENLNIFYVPVDSVPAWIGSPELTNDCEAGPAAMLLPEYDYSRAKSLHRRPRGLYLISTEEPLNPLDDLPEHHIEMDLSSRDPAFVGRWVELFIEQAEQEKFWETLTADEFRLLAREKIRSGGRAIGVIVFWSFAASGE